MVNKSKGQLRNQTNLWIIAETFPKTEAYINEPSIIITIVNIFSESVVAETFPNLYFSN